MGYLDNSSVTVDAILTNKGREILATGGKLNITKFALSDDEIDYDLWNPAHTLGTNYYGAVIENMPVLEALPDETQMLRYKLVTLPKDVIGIPVISVTPTSITFTSLRQEQTITPATLNLAGGNSMLGYTAILSDDTVATLEVAADGGVTRTVGFLGRAQAAAQAAVRQAAASATGRMALPTIVGPDDGGLGAPVGGGRRNVLTQALGSISPIQPMNMNTSTNTSIIAAEANAYDVANFLDDEVTDVTTSGKTIIRTGSKFIVRPKAQANLTKIQRALLTIIGNETGGFKTISITVDPTGFSAIDIQTGLATSI
jgi:hypothetical protein